MYNAIEESDEVELEIAWDDVSGAELDPRGVRKAMAEEIGYLRVIDLYDKVPTTECFVETGKPPICTRWWT